jgi:tRNA threonylcarbamoyladenosine biosynthesis protein TsaB
MKWSAKLFMMTLALEFSSSQRSVALTKGDSILGETIETGGRNTAAFSMIEKVLAAAKMEREQIEMICVGLGPGSYTGIRAAISIAQGWQLARQTQVAGVSSVEAIVAQAQSENIFGEIRVVVDAQRNEFYLASFDISKNGWNEVEPLKIVTRADIQSQAGKEKILAGPEVTKWFPEGRDVFPRASHLARLAARASDAMPADKLEPIYLRETTFVKAVPLI